MDDGPLDFGTRPVRYESGPYSGARRDPVPPER
jgi:hypothetical protein